MGKKKEEKYTITPKGFLGDDMWDKLSFWCFKHGYNGIVVLHEDYHGGVFVNIGQADKKKRREL